MLFIRRLSLGSLLLLLMANTLMAAEDVTAQALKLNDKHRYDDAARLLHPAIAAMDANRQPSASLAMGMIYLNSAMLYRDMYQTAQVIELDYLRKLGKQKIGTPSRYIDLYLGSALLEDGNAAAAAKYLQKFARTKAIPSTDRALGEVELGIAYSQQKQTQKASQLWSGLDEKNPEIKAALAGAYALTNMAGKKPSLLADAALSDAKVQGYTPNVRMVKNLLRAYGLSGDVEKALGLLNVYGLNTASFVENLDATKSISFYDLSLLSVLHKVYLGAAVMYLERAAQDAKLSNNAAFYLADAYLEQGKVTLSLGATANFLSQAQLPQQYRNIALVKQATAQSVAGKRAEANVTWQSIVGQSTSDPALLANVILACANSGNDCRKLEKQALMALDKGEGKKFFPLNAALGKYYLLQKDYAKAEHYLESGRDKANKNKIEANDPQLLVALAEAYYRNKKFSENLEIYFELGKQYPAVRQIQDAMQGIYSMEQQSAGDVKIF